MIGIFKHKGLKRLYGKGDESKISSALLPKFKRIVALLYVAASPDDLDLPAFRLHPINGRLPISSIKSEHVAKSIAIARKIFKFSDTVSGAEFDKAPMLPEV